MYIFLSGDFLNANHAFMAGFMRKPWRASQIANRVYARFIGRAPLVHYYVRFIDFDFCAFKSKIFDIADNAYGHNNAVNGYVAGFATGFERYGHVVLAFF